MISRRVAFGVTLGFVIAPSAWSQRILAEIQVRDYRKGKSEPPEEHLSFLLDRGPAGKVSVSTRRTQHSSRRTLEENIYVLSRLPGNAGYDIVAGETARNEEHMLTNVQFGFMVALDLEPFEAAARVIREARSGQVDHASAMDLLARTARAGHLYVPPSAPHSAAFVRGLPVLNR